MSFRMRVQKSKMLYYWSVFYWGCGGQRHIHCGIFTMGFTRLVQSFSFSFFNNHNNNMKGASPVLITYESKILRVNTKIQRTPEQDLERPSSKNMGSFISTTPNPFESPPKQIFHSTQKIHDSRLDLPQSSQP